MTRFRHLLVALIAIVACAGQLQAQTGTIRGRIFDASVGGGVAGVDVTVADRTVVSGDDGRFVVTGVPAGTYTLLAARLGYRDAEQSITVVAGQTSTIDIFLVPAPVGIAPVVAIGYGERRQEDLTGVVQKVPSEEFNTGRIVSPEELIKAKVAGVQIVESNGGEPGGEISIRVRGGTSVNATNEPLIVLDGVPLGIGGGLSAGRNGLNFVNPEDIESITVLKDAASTAIYGTQGANGVIIIETKRGRATVGGQGTRLSYVGTVSGSYISNEPKVLSAGDFREAVAEYNEDALSLLGNENTDWRDAVQRNGFGQEHNVAFAGASGDFDYRLSIGYLNQKGIVRGSSTERLSLGLNFSHFLFQDRLRLSANLRGSRVDDTFTPDGVIGGATAFAPTQPILDPESPNGGYFEWYNYTTALNNPVAQLDLTEDKGTTYRSVGNIQAEFDVPRVPGLRGTVRLGYDAAKAERKVFRPSFLRQEAESDLPGFLSRTNPTDFSGVFDAFASYDRSFDQLGGTDFNATVGYSYYRSQFEEPYLEAEGLAFDLLRTSGVPASDRQRNTIWEEEFRWASFFARANIGVQDRYLLMLSVRRDGSSSFGEGNEWATFPAVGLAWRAINEPFMQDQNLFSDLKFRASWGQNGNTAIGAYRQYPSYAIGDDRVRYQFGDDFVTTIRPGAADRGLKWEQTNSWDIGVDFGFASNRYTGAIDYYFKKTEDLIREVPVPAGTFTSNYILTNVGTLENRGLELSLNALLADGRDGGFSWTANFNASTNSNEIVKINPTGGEEVILVGDISGGVGNRVQVLQRGQPINSFYVYRHKHDEDGKPIYADEDGDGIADPSDLLLMYEDLNGDGQIDEDDRAPFEHPAPNWILGHSSRMTWGRFDASFTLRAHLGNYVYNNVASNNGHYRVLRYVGAPNNLDASVLETGFGSEQYFSDYYVQKASFLTMDNLTVGYTFSLRSAQQMRVFGTIQNVFMWTGYDGVDPLAGVNGIDNNLYPRSRTLVAGASVWF